MTHSPKKPPIKFHIDGDIESPKESKYLQNVDRNLSKKLKTSTLLLSILLVASVGFLVWQYTVITELKTKLSTALHDASAEVFNQRLDSLAERNDSLAFRNAKLQIDNEMLVENSDQLDGIFFEVHLNFSGDFNLDVYRSELARLESKEFDNREKLILARFRSFRKALLFENDLRKMGITDIFLLGRVDGEIMTFKEALAIAQSENK